MCCAERTWKLLTYKIFNAIFSCELRRPSPPPVGACVRRGGERKQISQSVFVLRHKFNISFLEMLFEKCPDWLFKSLCAGGAVYSHHHTSPNEKHEQQTNRRRWKRRASLPQLSSRGVNRTSALCRCVGNRGRGVLLPVRLLITSRI